MIRMHNTDISSKYTDIAVRNTEHNFTRLEALLLEAQWRKYDSVQHSANGGTTWPFSTPEATWEVQVYSACHFPSLSISRSHSCSTVVN